MSTSPHSSSSLVWIWTGTPGGQLAPNSETGMAPWNSRAALTPAPVWASICAGSTPEREPGLDEPLGQALGGEPAALDDRIETDLLLGVAKPFPEIAERLAVVEIREWTTCPAARSVSGNARHPVVRPCAW